MRLPALLLCGLLAVPAWAQDASLDNGFGPNPVLPMPQKRALPTMNIAPATSWTGDKMPVAAKGLKVNQFAENLDHPRTVRVLPNGDVLVAETDAPPKPDDSKGIKGFVSKQIMKVAGSGTSKSANRITLLRDADGDGTAETRSVLIDHDLNSPFGMALVGGDLYVANTDGVVRFPYKPGVLKITDRATRLTDLPAGTINHHWTKDLTASRDGRYLYATVGSNSNVAENGFKAEEGRAAVWRIDRVTGAKTLFASGLRNPNGPSVNPQTGDLWVVVNERDELGNDLVPDYMTSVKEGAFYGWPFSYYGQHVDARVEPQNAELVAKAVKPDYALGAHTASLGLTFYTGTMLPQFKDGAIIGQHGSWNRKPRSGYKVIFVPFADGRPVGKPQDVLTGFLDKDGNAQGRPVGVAQAKDGAILVADDVGNAIWRVSRD